MTESDRSATVPEPSDGADLRSAAAAWMAGGALVSMACARWEGFLYPHYVGGVLFHVAGLLLILVWAWPSRRRSVAGGSWAAQGLLGAYAVFLALNALRAKDPRLSMIGALPTVFGVLWAMLLGRLLRRREDVRFALRMIVIAGALAALAGCWAMLSEYPDPEEWQGAAGFVRRFLAPLLKVFGHRNFLAMFLLPPILLTAQEALPKRLATTFGARGLLGMGRGLSACAGALMLGVMVCCMSIGALIGLAAGVAVLIAPRLPRWGRIVLFGIPCAAAVAGLLVLARPSVEAMIAPHQQMQRWFLWKGAAAMALEHPLLGWGAGMFLPHFADFKPTLPMQYNLLTMITLHPHNEVLMVLIEGGIVGVALYVCGLAGAVRRALRCAAGDAETSATAFGVVACIVAMFVHSLVEVSLRFWGPSALFWTLAGLLLAVPNLAARPSESATPLRERRGVRFAGFALCAAAVVVFARQVTWKGMEAEWLAGGAYRTVVRTGADGRARKVMARGTLSFPAGAAYRAPSSREEMESFKRRYLDDLRRAAECSRYVPDYFIALRRLGEGQMQMGLRAAAVATFERLEAEAPGYGAVRVWLGGLYLSMAREGRNAVEQEENLRRAHECFGRALRQNPTHPAALLGAAEVLLLASPRNLGAALDHLERLTTLNERVVQPMHRDQALKCLENARRVAARSAPEMAERLDALEAAIRRMVPSASPAREDG